MAFKVEINGKIVEFDKRPTVADIDDVAKKLGIGKKPLKEAWKIHTPEELVQRGMGPGRAGLTATTQQLTSPLWKYGNIFLGGLPSKGLQAMGYKAPEAQIKMATPFGEKDITRPVNLAANIGGFVRGVPMKVAGAVAAGIPGGVSLPAKIALGALRGATQLGGATALTTPAKEAISDWKARAGRAVGAGAVGAVGGGISGLIKHFSGLLSTPAQLKTGRQVRAKFWGFKKRLSRWFEGKLDKFQKAHPNNKVDITKPIKNFEAGLEDKMKFKSLLKVSPRLRKARLKAAAGQDLTLRESQDLVNQLKSTVSDRQLAGFKVKPSGNEVNQFIKSIQEAKHTAFPAIRATDKAYGKMKEYLGAIENYMEFGKTVQGLRTIIANTERRKALQMVLPKSIFDKVAQTVTAGKVTHQGMRTLDYIIRYGILYKVAKDLTGKLEPGSGGYESGIRE